MKAVTSVRFRYVTQNFGCPGPLLDVVKERGKGVSLSSRNAGSSLTDPVAIGELKGKAKMQQKIHCKPKPLG